MISLADIREAQNDFLGTSELNLYTEQRRINAINRAVREIIKHYDINEYTQKVTVLPDNNGNFDVPDDFLRSAKLYREQFWEYLQVDFDRFEYQIPNSYTIRFNAVTDTRYITVYPVVSPMYFWYIQLPPKLVDDTDEVRFQIYWTEAIAAKSVEILMIGSRLVANAQAMREQADKYIADAWQSDRSYLQGKEDQRLQSVYEKRSLLGMGFGFFDNYTLQPMFTGSMAWVEINSNASIQAAYGYDQQGSSDVILTLPVQAQVGDTFAVVRTGTGNWRVAQNAGQSIIFGNIQTTVGVNGYLESTAVGDTIQAVCIEQNTTWAVTPGAVGNITYV